MDFKLICVMCQKQFLVFPYRKDTAKYCSRKCTYLDHGRKCKKDIKISISYVRQKCFQCSKEFFARFRYIKKGWGRYCSRQCYGISKTTNHLQDKSPNWKGGITSIDKIERIKFRKEIQKLVFERDNYTCQLCKSRGVDLQVDHIQSWAEYVELRFNINNCRTLCMKCHYQITFGKPMPPTVRTWGHNLLRRVEL